MVSILQLEYVTCFFFCDLDSAVNEQTLYYSIMCSNTKENYYNLGIRYGGLLVKL